MTEILPNMTAYITLVSPLESTALAFAPLSRRSLTSLSLPLKEAPIKAVPPEWSLICVRPVLQKELGDLEVIVVGCKDERSVALIVRLIHVSFCTE
ncbi:hypothetical protein RBB77_17755 [Tunturibacter psychrotolerans]|uniref:Uncharacterized protein n=1 Tax=Tunturiibacter psychrotolerans TaxID=3069686 RepID=A0AAU7ZM20_9BACT